MIPQKKNGGPAGIRIPGGYPPGVARECLNAEQAPWVAVSSVQFVHSASAFWFIISQPAGRVEEYKNTDGKRSASTT
jgi:hypothetical protein